MGATPDVAAPPEGGLAADTFEDPEGPLKETARWSKASCEAERFFSNAAWTSLSAKSEDEARSDELRRPMLLSAGTCLAKKRQTVSLLLKTRFAHRLLIWVVRNASARPPEISNHSNFTRSSAEDPPGMKSFKVLDQRSNHDEAWRADMATDSKPAVSAAEKEIPSFRRESTEQPSVSWATDEGTCKGEAADDSGR